MKTNQKTTWIAFSLLTAALNANSQDFKYAAYPEDFLQDLAVESSGGNTQGYTSHSFEVGEGYVSHSYEVKKPLQNGEPSYSYNLGEPSSLYQRGIGSAQEGQKSGTPLASDNQAQRVLEESKMILQTIAEKADASGRNLMQSCRNALDRIGQYISKLPETSASTAGPIEVADAVPQEQQTENMDTEALPIESTVLDSMETQVPNATETDSGSSLAAPASDPIVGEGTASGSIIAERLRVLAEKVEQIAREVENDR